MKGLPCGMVKMQNSRLRNMGEEPSKTLEKLRCEKYARAKITRVNTVTNKKHSCLKFK
jgi:hypothetical protein